MSTNVSRHPAASTSSASGNDAARPPTLPTVCVHPAAVANSSARSQAAMRLSHAIRMTDAPTAISSRPATATPKVGASPKRAVPKAIATPPPVSVRRGPTPSARLPAISAMAAKTYG
jgi:hypothetical protein